MNANIVSIYNTETAYLRAEQNNRLFCLGRVYDLDFGLHKSSCLKIKTTKIYRAPIVSPKLQLMLGGDRDNSAIKCREWGGDGEQNGGDADRTCGVGGHGDDFHPRAGL